MNARSLKNFFRQRCCNRAQWEIRELARRMLLEVRKVSPALFREAGPACLAGPCPEGEDVLRARRRNACALRESG